MATSSSDLPTEPYKLAKYGISLVINNRTSEAEELFKTNLDTIQMSAGYAFVVFMDAIMSFEDEKLEIALNVLRETEKKCATNIGWLKSVKSKVLGLKTTDIADRLETQIILADTQVCVAIITFLQQDFSGYIKGGWVMRKAWKIYQHTYTEIMDIYKQNIGNFNLPEPTDFNWQNDQPISTNSSVTPDPSEQEEWTIPDSNNPSPSTRQSTSNGYVQISSPKPKIPQSQSSYFFSKSPFFPFSIKRSGSAHSSLTNNTTNVTGNSGSTFSFFSPISAQLSYLTSTLNLLSSSDDDVSNEIDPETIARLMSGVCFGYGVLQLGISLLPPSMLKVTNFFGFHGNRTTGISNLMYARKGTDMRAPLATLALLWYHTIVRPFYALDGTNVKAGIEAANLLLGESQAEFENSALFLFFKGRIHRLDSNIPQALKSFQLATDNSSQREVKLLSLHEVGWCYLIQLDYIEAQKVFLQLKIGSRWSKCFYSYLSIICSGSSGKKDINAIKELSQIYSQTRSKYNQLDLYIQRRIKIFPNNDETLENTPEIFWKLLTYELIYLWNALPSCSFTNLNKIIEDCNEITSEPMPGLATLIQGECFAILGFYDNAIKSLRNCLTCRSKISPKDDIHISAYAEHALGVLLLKNLETKAEGKAILQHSSNYKDYDFDNKLLVRINSALKNNV